MQIITADFIYYAGRAQQNLAIQIDGRGRVQAVGALAQLGSPTLALPGRLILPGLVDVYCPSALPTADEAPLGAARALMLRVQLMRRLAMGVTTVGLPHVVADDGDTPWAQADCIMDAAATVGLRVAMLDTFDLTPTKTSPKPSLDAAIGRFELLVQRVLARRDNRLSWALLAPTPAAMPLDALVALRLRLGHLPCLVGLDASDADPQVARLVAAGLVDAGLTVLDSGNCTETAQASLRHGGARWGLQTPSWPRLGPAPVTPSITSPAHLACFTGQSDAISPLPQLPSPVNPGCAQRLLRAAGVGGTTALGLRGGALGQGSWADLFTLPIAPLAQAAAQVAHLPLGEALPLGVALATPQLACDVMVAGRWLVGGPLGPS